MHGISGAGAFALGGCPPSSGRLGFRPMQSDSFYNYFTLEVIIPVTGAPAPVLD